MGDPAPAQQAVTASGPSNLDGLKVLAGQAKSGQLYLDPSVAADCAAACDKLVLVLNGAKKTLKDADILINLGGFDCGTALAHLLQGLVSGAESFSQRLDEHELAVKLIHDMVRSQVDKIETTDDDLRLSVNQTGH